MIQSTKQDFEINRITRRNILTAIEELSFEQISKVPKGFSNSILWNFMHNMVTQQLLTLGLTGEKSILEEEIIDKFRKGSKGTNTLSETSFEHFKSSYTAIVDQTEELFEKLKTQPFKEYTTSYNITLHSLEEAVQFINTHEGVHLGIIMTIKKFV